MEENTLAVKVSTNFKLGIFFSLNSISALPSVFGWYHSSSAYKTLLQLGHLNMNIVSFSLSSLILKENVRFYLENKT